MKIEVGDKVELNNGEVHEVDRMLGNDPDHVNYKGYGPFVVGGARYHQNGCFYLRDYDHSLSVKRILHKASSDTLENLNVGPGDVVEHDGTRGGKVKRYIIAGWVGASCYHTGQSLGGAFNMDPGSCWRVVRRASDDTPSSQKGEPKLWRDMTDEEKGALLLAYHEGKAIEQVLDANWIEVDPYWADNVAYRIKPEPVREAVTIDDKTFSFKAMRGHRITFDLINGKPDPASIKMEKV